jgi:hypothetical protein
MAFVKPTQSSLLADAARQKAEGDRDRAAQRAAADSSRGSFKPGNAPPRVTTHGTTKGA